MQRLLHRQLKKLGIDPKTGPESAIQWQQFVAKIDKSYEEQNQDRYTLERSLMISSEEMRKLYRSLEARSNSKIMEQRIRLRVLIDALPDMIFYRGEDGLYLTCNKAAELYFGVSEDQLEGRGDQACFSGEISQFFQQLDREVVATGSTLQKEVRLEIPDQGERVVEAMVVPLLDKKGKVTGRIGIFRDITDLKLTEEKIRQAATVFKSSNECIIITDTKGAIIAVNAAFTELMGYTEAEVLGQKADFLRSGRHSDQFYRDMWCALQKTGSWRGQIWDRNKNGHVIPGWLNISAVLDEQGAVSHYVSMFSDISEIKRSQDLLQYQAHHDSLTGLPNRPFFNARLEHTLLTARASDSNCAILFLDLDRFKMINDTLGHPVGDEVLKIMAQRLTYVVRGSDTVARLGGDEYVIILHDVEDTADAERVAAKVLSSVSKPFQLEGEDLSISVSIGIALFPQDGVDTMTLIKNADAAMYRAKDQGRGNYQLFSSDLASIARESLSMESDLRVALEKNHLELHYQPQYAMDGKTLISAEALVRWRHKEKGLILPNKFIPLAEESGLINLLGDWVLEESCRQWMAWHAKGYPEIAVAVNLSGRQVMSGGLVQRVKVILQQSGMPPHRLKLEITETSLMDNAETSTQVLSQLNALGVKLAIDDFGTGYSSMSYLKRFDMDEMKIDRSFVQDLPGDPNDVAIVRSIIALGHSLQMEVLAEGVEREEQLAFLKQEGCDKVQGFLLNRPLTAAAFEELLMSVVEITAPCSAQEERVK
ncbi:MAG: EAL domain-containing protein [Gammaproteobacteria bacterium]|nr:EAL domain-containing protein [Gammaproteobacteria bacterium]